jgi:hypothetical protein
MLCSSGSMCDWAPVIDLPPYPVTAPAAGGHGGAAGGAGGYRPDVAALAAPFISSESDLRAQLRQKFQFTQVDRSRTAADDDESDAATRGAGGGAAGRGVDNVLARLAYVAEVIADESRGEVSEAVEARFTRLLGMLERFVAGRLDAAARSALSVMHYAGNAADGDNEHVRFCQLGFPRGLSAQP